MRYIFLALINFYRRYISPLKRPCCRFTPTCSAYAYEAIKVHGAFVGTILMTYRILRCNPFCRGGYDPPPEKGKVMNYLFKKGGKCQNNNENDSALR